MFKHECYKIFTRKSIYIVLFLVILAMIYANSLPNEGTMKEDIYEDLYETWGGPITEEKVSFAREQMRKSDAGENSALTREDRATDLVHSLYSVASGNNESLNERKGMLQDKMDTLNVKSYTYKVVSKELGMLKKLGEPYAFYLTGGWRDMFSFIEPATTAIFLSILILLGVTPVFANEYTNRTAGLILATKHGKRKIVSAKILAVLTYIAVVLILLHFVNGILQLTKYGGLQGWNTPIQNLSNWLDSLSMISFDQSPYAFEIWQLYVLTFGLQFIACIAVAILVILISIVFKNTMQTLLICSAVIGVPFMLAQFTIDKGIKGILSHITSFNYGEFMKVTGLFKEFKVYNVFGYPVSYPYLLIAIFAIITTIFMILIYNRYRHTQISH